MFIATIPAGECRALDGAGTLREAVAQATGRAVAAPMRERRPQADMIFDILNMYNQFLNCNLNV